MRPTCQISAPFPLLVRALVQLHPFFTRTIQSGRSIIIHKNKIKRRRAIGVAIAACGSVGLPSASAGAGLGGGDDAVRQIRELHLNLWDFNREIVPRMIEVQGDAPTYDQKRAKRFLSLSLWMRRKLDQRSGNPPVAFDATLLQRRLKQLNVRSTLECSRFDHSVIHHPAMGFLSDQQGNPGHAFVSRAPKITPTRLIESAARICLSLKSSAKGMDAIGVVREASIDDLELAFASMDQGAFLELVEPLFLSRPETPVSLLKLHSSPTIYKAGCESAMSRICGNLMERLANNHFHQTIAISQRTEWSGSQHVFIAGQVFDILVQKWLWLMRVEQNRAPIEMDDASDQSLAKKRCGEDKLIAS